MQCNSCKSQINEGAKRCASCGQHVGLLSTVSTFATIAGAVLAVVSLVTIATTLVTEHILPKSAVMSIRATDAGFSDIRNLTCRRLDNQSDLPLMPQLKGLPPGDTLVLEGTITNNGNVVGELRVGSGGVFDKDFSKRADLSQPLAVFDAPFQNDKYLVEPGATVSFSAEFKVYANNSRGFLRGTIEGFQPFDEGDVPISTQEIGLTIYTYQKDKIEEDRVYFNLPIIMLAPRNSWFVDGKRLKVKDQICAPIGD